MNKVKAVLGAVLGVYRSYSFTGDHEQGLLGAVLGVYRSYKPLITFLVGVVIGAVAEAIRSA